MFIALVKAQRCYGWKYRKSTHCNISPRSAACYLPVIASVSFSRKNHQPPRTHASYVTSTGCGKQLARRAAVWNKSLPQAQRAWNLLIGDSCGSAAGGSKPIILLLLSLRTTELGNSREENFKVRILFPEDLVMGQLIHTNDKTEQVASHMVRGRFPSLVWLEYSSMLSRWLSCQVLRQNWP